MNEQSKANVFSRRAVLVGGAAAVLAACSTSSENADDPTNETASTDEATSTSTSTSTQTSDADPVVDQQDPAEMGELAALNAAMFTALPVCALLPSSTAGPFPTIEQLDRRDVTEGYPGHPLRLGIRVTDQACAPVPGAQIEIWHCDATGDYSVYDDGGSGKDEGNGTTFLRGFQTADADGILEFQTIYPGWYEGRAIHIHVRARVNGELVLTAQLYFDGDYSASVLATGEYAQFGLPDTTVESDFLVGDPTIDGTGIQLTPGPTSLGEGTLGLVNLGIPA